MSITNIQVLDISNGLIHIKTEEMMMQISLSSIFLMRIHAETKKLELYLPQITLTAETVSTEIANKLPSVFFRFPVENEILCINMRRVAFLNWNKKAMIVHFDSGMPLTFSMDNESVFFRMCEIHESLR